VRVLQHVFVIDTPSPEKLVSVRGDWAYLYGDHPGLTWLLSTGGMSAVYVDCVCLIVCAAAAVTGVKSKRNCRMCDSLTAERAKLVPGARRTVAWLEDIYARMAREKTKMAKAAIAKEHSVTLSNVRHSHSLACVVAH